MNIFLKKLCISNQMYVNPSKDQCFPFLNPSSFFYFFFSSTKHSGDGPFVDTMKPLDYHTSGGSAWRTSEGWRVLSPVIMTVIWQLSDWSQGPLGALSKVAVLSVRLWTALHRGQRLITSGLQSTLQLNKSNCHTWKNKNMKNFFG